MTVMISTGDICLLAAVTVLGCYQLATFAMKIGHLRGKYNIQPPTMDGPPDFVRAVRAQANSNEFFVVYLPLMWMAGIFIHQIPAAAVGLVYTYARHKYFHGYVREAADRVPGVLLAGKCLLVLSILSITGIVNTCIGHFLGLNLTSMVGF